MGPPALPAETVTGVVAKPAPVGVHDEKVDQAGVNAAPSTAAVHQVAAHAPAPGAAGSAERAIASASRLWIAATSALKSLEDRPSEFEGSQAKPIRSVLHPS